jgi:hypothetical protein
MCCRWRGRVNGWRRWRCLVRHHSAHWWCKRRQAIPWESMQRCEVAPPHNGDSTQSSSSCVHVCVCVCAFLCVRVCGALDCNAARTYHVGPNTTHTGAQAVASMRFRRTGACRSSGTPGRRARCCVTRWRRRCVSACMGVCVCLCVCMCTCVRVYVCVHVPVCACGVVSLFASGCCYVAVYVCFSLSLCRSPRRIGAVAAVLVAAALSSCSSSSTSSSSSLSLSSALSSSSLSSSSFVVVVVCCRLCRLCCRRRSRTAAF